MNKIKEKLDSEAEQVSANRLKLFELNKNLKLQQDKWNNFVNKYKANKKVYYLLKTEKKETENIPELFQLEWPIFKYLDKNNYMIETNDNLDAELRVYYKLQPTEKINITHTYDGLFSSNILDANNYNSDCESDDIKSEKSEKLISPSSFA